MNMWELDWFKWPENIEAWLKSNSSSFNEEKVSNVNNLRVVNDILDKIKLPDDIEEEYRKKLLKLDNDSLDQLVNMEWSNVEKLLQKSQIEIKQYLIQAQINELEAKWL